MKLHVLSDLHLEFGGFSVPETDADVVVLAGDTHVGEHGVRWAADAFKGRPVLYVMGNHEYYGHVYPKCLDEARRVAQGTNVRVLENELVTVGGARFFGCTLWTDFRLFGDPQLAGFACRETVSDFTVIRTLPKYSKFRPEDAVRLHVASKKALGAALRRKGGVDVIITHHAPSRRSLAEQFKADPVSAAFISDLDDLIVKSGAKLWIHGHVHSSWDYAVGDTRVLCNPRGYPGEAGAGFQSELLVQI